MIPALLERLREPLAAAGIAWAPSVDRCFVYNNFGPLISSVLVFAHPPRGREPGFVVKLSRTRSLVEAEHSHLEHLRPILGPLVPRPIAFGRMGSWAYLAMEAMPGRQLRHDSSPPAAVVDALVAIQVRVRSRQPLSVDEVDAMTFGARASDELDATVRVRLERYHANLLDALTPALPERIPQHGDFVIQNMVANRKRIAVVDWENYGRSAVPYYDLLWLFSSPVLAEGRSYVQTLGREPAQLEALARAVSCYTEALGLDRTLFLRLLPGLMAQLYAHNREDGRRLAARLAYEVTELFSRGSTEEHPVIRALRSRIE